MKQPPIILFAGDDGWKIARGEAFIDVPSPGAESPNQVAGSIAAIIGSASPVTLALPASWCLSATVPLQGVPARNRRTALLYRLELLLPLAAEDIAADYILNEPNSALAVCVGIPALKPLVDALENAGVVVTSIIPASIYAVASVLSKSSAEPCDLLMWQTSQSLEIFEIQSGRQSGCIASWYMALATPEDLGWYLDQRNSSVALKVSAYNLQPELLHLLNSRGSLVTSTHQDTVEAVAASAKAAQFQSPIEFQRDGLGPRDGLRTIRGPMRELLVAALLMIVCICAAAFWRAAGLEKMASADRLQQQKLFQQAFPGRAVPPNIVSRLRSEEQSLKRGESSQGDGLIPKSALPTLQDILAGIGGTGGEVRLEVNDLKVGDQQFTLDGVVRNRADLTAIVGKLDEHQQLKLDAPQTEQMGGQGLHIILTGSRVSEAIKK